MVPPVLPMRVLMLLFFAALTLGLLFRGPRFPGD